VARRQPADDSFVIENWLPHYSIVVSRYITLELAASCRFSISMDALNGIRFATIDFANELLRKCFGSPHLSPLASKQLRAQSVEIVAVGDNVSLELSAGM
jgi:hypothetical protein